MKIKTGCLLLTVVLASCSGNIKGQPNESATIPIEGTWKLISGMVIEKGDTTVTNYTKNISFIKIINDTHFAFLKHDLKKGKDSTAVFVAGGGRYTLKDSLYTEHLTYCSAREWEDNSFTFAISISNDTLIQRGIEKVESASINRINIEKYVRVEQ